MTGYLTQRDEPEGKRYNLVVPNLEIRNIIVSHVLLLFQRKVEEDGKLSRAFARLLKEEKMKRLNSFLMSIWRRPSASEILHLEKMIKKIFIMAY